jgi:hypothetical protein
MPGLPSPIVPPGSQPSVLSPLAQQFAAQYEAARAPQRPLDAVRGALHAAYKGAMGTDASDSQNHHAGIIAANAKAYALKSTTTDATALAHIASEIVRYGALMQQLSTNPTVMVQPANPTITVQPSPVPITVQPAPVNRACAGLLIGSASHPDAGGLTHGQQMTAIR